MVVEVMVEEAMAVEAMEAGVKAEVRVGKVVDAKAVAA